MIGYILYGTTRLFTLGQSENESKVHWRPLLKCKLMYKCTECSLRALAYTVTCIHFACDMFVKFCWGFSLLHSLNLKTVLQLAAREKNVLFFLFWYAIISFFLCHCFRAPQPGTLSEEEDLVEDDVMSRAWLSVNCYSFLNKRNKENYHHALSFSQCPMDITHLVRLKFAVVRLKFLRCA